MTLKETFAKINEYSSLSAEEKSKRKKVKGIDLILHPLSAFLSHYVLKGGFRDGVYGLIVSLNHAMTNLQTYMKIWELQNVKSEDEKGK
jgi:hypothetical protein